MKQLCLVLITVLLAGCPPKRVYPDGRGLEGQLERELIALKQKMRILEETNECDEAGAPPRVYHDLVQIFSGGEAEVELVGGRVRVRIPNDHLFSSAKSTTLRDEATGTLDLMSTALKVHDKIHIEIGAHTDDSAPSRRLARDNIELTFKQGLVVKDKLISFEVDAHRFSIAAHGENQPLVSNDTEGNQRRNQRIEITLTEP